MKNSILTLLFSCGFFILTAQETNFLTINFSPQNIVLRIDDTKVISLKDKSNPYILSLPIGKHKIEAWSKGFEIQEYDIEVSSTEQKQLNIGMSKLNPEFQAYLDAQDEYTGSKAKGFGIVGLTTIFAGGAILSLAQGNNEKGKLFEDLASARAEYSGAINAFELSIAEEKQEKALNAIRGRRIFGFLSGTLAVGGSIIAYRYFNKKKSEAKSERPVYEEANPFVLYNYQKRYNTELKLTSSGIVLNF